MSTFNGPSLTSNQVEVIFVSSEGDKPPPFQFPEIQGATHVTPLPPTTPNAAVVYSGTSIDPSLPLRFSFGGLYILNRQEAFYVVSLVRNWNLVRTDSYKLNPKFFTYGSLSYLDKPIHPVNDFANSLPLEKALNLPSGAMLADYCNALVQKLQDGIIDPTPLKMDIMLYCSPTPYLPQEPLTLKAPLAKHITVPLTTIVGMKNAFGTAMSSTIIDATNSWNILIGNDTDANLHVDIRISNALIPPGAKQQVLELLLRIRNLTLSLKCAPKNIVTTSAGDFSFL